MRPVVKLLGYDFCMFFNIYAAIWRKKTSSYNFSA